MVLHTINRATTTRPSIVVVVLQNGINVDSRILVIHTYYIFIFIVRHVVLCHIYFSNTLSISSNT